MSLKHNFFTLWHRWVIRLCDGKLYLDFHFRLWFPSIGFSISRMHMPCKRFISTKLARQLIFSGGIGDHSRCAKNWHPQGVFDNSEIRCTVKNFILFKYIDIEQSQLAAS